MEENIPGAGQNVRGHFRPTPERTLEPLDISPPAPDFSARPREFSLRPGDFSEKSQDISEITWGAFGNSFAYFVHA
jgi:hypothetical protein